MTGRKRNRRAGRLWKGTAVIAATIAVVSVNAFTTIGAEEIPIVEEKPSEGTEEFLIRIEVEPIEQETEAAAPEETQAEAEKVFRATATGTLPASDQQMLVRVAMAEAEDQGTKGKALVMRVVLNRVADRAWPNNVHDVIYQKGQFEVISNGRYNRVTPDAGCYEALEWVMNGWDESQGAEYFCMAGESRWHENHLTRLFQYKDHVFYR